MADRREGLFVLGNLLLDMIATVEDSYLEEYGLLPDSTQMAREEHFKIYDDISKLPDVKVCPGGSALNTVRMLQTLLGGKYAITLSGAVGSDNAGKILIKTVEKEGIKMMAQVVENTPTGKCASLLTEGGTHRTMVTDLGASLKFSHEVFIKNLETLNELQRTKFLYISGYFLKVSPLTVTDVINRTPDAVVLLNLNAVWVTNVCKNELEQIFPSVDVIFGNDLEMKSFAANIGLSSCNSILDIAAGLSKKSDRNLIVVVTRGEQSVVCADSGASREYPVPLVPKEEILDTTGAGDAFVAGFLAQYVKGSLIDQCIACGIWAASEELKGYGFILPKNVNSPPFSS